MRRVELIRAAASFILPHMLEVGGELPGGFRVTGALGSGSVADVVSVTSRTGESLAAKVLHAHLAQEPSMLARFAQEAELLQAVQHEAVVGYRGHGRVEGRPFIVTERALGGDLAAWLRRQSPLAAEPAIEIGNALLDAVAALHRAGIVHRDLQPSNIHWGGSEQRRRLLIVDLSSAAWISGPALPPHDDRLTPSGHTMVTPSYACPEALTGRWVRDPRADLYAVAVVVFQLLTGHLPFEHADLAAQIRLIVETEAPPPTVFGPVPEGLCAWLARALRRDGEARFADAAAMRQALVECTGWDR